MSDLTKLFEATEQFVQALVGIFGPWGTIGIFVGLVLITSIRRIYLDRRKDREVNLAISQMEKALQRATNEAREWRILFLKDKFNWTDEQVARFIIQAEFPDPVSARQALEGNRRRTRQERESNDDNI